MPKLATLPAPLVFPLGWLAAILVFFAVSGSIWIAHLNNTRVQYFPETFLENGWAPGHPRAGQDGKVIVDASEQTWYSSYWRAAGEPSLYLASRNPESPQSRSLRFTWLRSFHASIIVRIDTLADGRLAMTATRLDGAGGYAGLKVGRKIVRPLTLGEQDSLATMLASTSVLALAPANDQFGLDGARWIIEGSAPGEYRYINRWSPNPERSAEAMPVREAGLFLLGLTGWNLEPIY